ncbi:MAG: NADP-dependent oxidoreductase [Cyanobacteria bacterium CRU_2_1]|nr:NADP-dependent oxidoreductase [Cyanobacteria bacterium CRU_2_1]
MKAVRIHAYGGPETLHYDDVPIPVPGKGEVLIQVHAAAVNPIDWKIREGWLQQVFNYPLPVIVGTDVAGVVHAIGEGVTTLRPGQAVYGVVDMTLSGAYAEYAVGHEWAIAPKPETLDYIHAASVPVVALTAWQALFEVGQLQSGQSILIHGAAGGVGSFAVQFAKAKGIQAIGTASGQNIDYVRELGAAQVIDYNATAFEQATSEVDMVLDLVGGETQTRSWNMLKPGGILVSTATPPSKEIAEQRGVRAAMMMVQPNASQLAEISNLIDAGLAKTLVENVFPLAEAQQAQQLSQQGHPRGKIVLQVI